jgi:hypothetical protein
MRRRASLWALVPVLLAVGLASAQESYPIMERAGIVPDHGEGRRESHPEIPDLVLSGSGQAEEPAAERATGADGAARAASTAERSADAYGIHQSRGGAHRQQTVRVRHDSLSTMCPESAASPSGHAHEHQMKRANFPFLQEDFKMTMQCKSIMGVTVAACGLWAVSTSSSPCAQAVDRLWDHDRRDVQ